MTETNHQCKRTGNAPPRAQQQQGPPCLTTRHRHALSEARRRAYGDGETTAGLEHAGASIKKYHPQPTGTRKQATTQSATFMQLTQWKPFSLDKLLQERLTNSYRKGHIDLVRNDLSDIAAGVIEMMTRGRWWKIERRHRSWLHRCGPPVRVCSGRIIAHLAVRMGGA